MGSLLSPRGGFAEETTTVLDYDSASNLIYSGKAETGSSKAVGKWQIKKYTYSGDNLTDIQFAGGKGDFLYVWDNRSGYSYS